MLTFLEYGKHSNLPVGIIDLKASFFLAKWQFDVTKDLIPVS